MLEVQNILKYKQFIFQNAEKLSCLVYEILMQIPIFEFNDWSQDIFNRAF